MIGIHTRPSFPQAQKTAIDFETAFLSQSLQFILEPLAEEGLFGAGEDSRMFVSFLSEHLAQKISEDKGIGVAEQILPSLMKDSQQINTLSTPVLSSSMLVSFLHKPL